MKKYKCGLYIGRFQPLHVGHTHIIAQMLEECEKVIIAIGSSQEKGTQKNPFSYSTRELFIRQCFLHCLSKITIISIPDRKVVSNDASWGDYVFERIKSYGYELPDVIYEGKESERTTWYDNLNVDVVRVPRTIIPISATEIREGILADDEMIIRMYIPYGIRDKVEFMKEVIKDVSKK